MPRPVHDADGFAAPGPIPFRVNGEERAPCVHPMSRLLDVLREDLALTGTKEGCGEGECGACAVMVDGRLVDSCLVPVAQVRGRDVTTIEGLGRESLAAVQRAFAEHGGAQCGICTPGMIMAAKELLDRVPHPREEDVREALAGNICRCTGYVRIFESVLRAVALDRGAT